MWKARAQPVNGVHCMIRIKTHAVTGIEAQCTIRDECLKSVKTERKQDQGLEYYPDRSLVCGQDQGSVYEHDQGSVCK